MEPCLVAGRWYQNMPAQGLDGLRASLGTSWSLGGLYGSSALLGVQCLEQLLGNGVLSGAHFPLVV